ncbi:hypothetical protein NE237_008091 [Protea cynaroides]|uniref:Protein kinase domain-containing protein n=1 Tax=Protea cynaroides TaxID=273540 RepID=A0A9Q0KQE1_9MAGN|nr:hypothetical protein NE237_008091 [Protea cynaroides]
MTRHWHEINLANLAINKIQNQAIHELVDPCLGYESDDSVRRMITSVAALAFRCLQYDMELRPSMEEVLEVLRGIESADYGVEVVDIPMEHTPPPPLPITPDSFTGKWVDQIMISFHLVLRTISTGSDNNNCNTLFNNFTMPPIFHHLSTELISPNLTLRVCKCHQDLNGRFLVGVIKDCEVEVLPDADATPAPRPNLDDSLYDCKLVQLPVDVPPSKFHGPVDPVSQLFTPGFRLRWSLPQPCHQCEKNGTICGQLHHHQANEKLFCFDPKKRGDHREVYLLSSQIFIAFRSGIGAGVWLGMLLTCIFFLIIYQYRSNSSWKREIETSITPFGIPIFSYTELEEATNNFSSVNELGEGGFGTVYHGNLRDGRVVAIKHLYHNNKKHVERFMNEIVILTRLRHPNLVTLYGCTSYQIRELLLVYEFIPNGTVADHPHGDRAKLKVVSLTWPVRMSIAIETARALSYLHASDIIHRDVKTSNILLDNNFHVKVADVGLCLLFPTDTSHVSTAPQGSPGYVDPEYHRCYQLTDKSDVYSFGVVLIELISSKPAVEMSRHREEINLANMAMKNIQNGALHELVDPFLGFESDDTRRRLISVVAELAFRCLQNDREMRPSMDEVLEILLIIGGEEDKVDNAEVVMHLLSSYDVKLHKSIPSPPSSPDSETDKLISTVNYAQYQ